MITEKTLTGDDLIIYRISEELINEWYDSLEKYTKQVNNSDLVCNKNTLQWEALIIYNLSVLLSQIMNKFHEIFHDEFLSDFSDYTKALAKQLEKYD